MERFNASREIISFGIEDDRTILGDWFFKFGVFAREVFYLACFDLCIEPLRIAFRTGFQARAHIHFEKIIAAHSGFGQSAQVPSGGDETSQGDNPGVEVEFGHLADPPDVFRAIVVAESEVRVEARANIIPIENLGEPAFAMEAPFQSVGDGALAASTQTVEPDNETPLLEQGLFVRAAEHAVEFGVDVGGVQR